MLGKTTLLTSQTTIGRVGVWYVMATGTKRRLASERRAGQKPDLAAPKADTLDTLHASAFRAQLDIFPSAAPPIATRNVQAFQFIS